MSLPYVYLEVEAEGPEPKIIISYKASSRTAWVTGEFYLMIK